MDPIFELSLVLPTRDSRNLLRALHHQLRAAIVNGKLQAGLRLPATRKPATLAGVSRNTAVAVYELLQSQGYISIRPGAGAFVADQDSHPMHPSASLGGFPYQCFLAQSFAVTSTFFASLSFRF